MRAPPSRRTPSWTLGLVAPEVWASATPDERDAVRALAHHLRFRFEQKEHPPLEDGDCIFMTVPWMQGLLKALNARKKGEKAAAEAIHPLVRLGVTEDTGRVKYPRRSKQDIARAEKFQPPGVEIRKEGGQMRSHRTSAPAGGGCSASSPSRLSSEYRPLRAYNSG